MPAILTFGVPQVGESMSTSAAASRPLIGSTVSRYTKMFEVVDPAKEVIEHVAMLVEKHITEVSVIKLCERAAVVECLG